MPQIDGNERPRGQRVGPLRAVRSPPQGAVTLQFHLAAAVRKCQFLRFFRGQGLKLHFTVYITIGVLAPGLASSLLRTFTNCGGNSEALASVGTYARLSCPRACPTGEKLEAALENLVHTRLHAHLLVSTEPKKSGEPKRIVVVCDRSFRNLPERWIGQAPPSHAAGYTDGTCGLISPGEFAAIDLSRFVFVDRMMPISTPAPRTPGRDSADP